MKVTVAEAEKLVQLVKQGDSHQVDLYLESIVTPNGKKILAEVESLLRDIQENRNEAFQALEGDLATAAAYRCRNALEQLSYIVKQGSESAHTTLELTEGIQERVQKLQELGKLPDVEAEKINTMLLEIMLSQSYQDLTEQVVIKLTSFIEKVESTLGQIVDLNKASDFEADFGPSVTNLEKQDVVADQTDIDALLMSNSEGV